MKANLIRITLTAILFFIALINPFNNDIISKILYIVGYIIVGFEIVLKAIKNIFKGKVFDEHFLMSIATIGAFVIGEYPEAVAVMLFYQLGELFQDYAVDKSKRSITNLMNIRPDYANIEVNGEIRKVSPEEINVGEEVLVNPGEKIPLDGIVIEGKSFVDTSALTGEFVPKKVQENDKVLSGFINQNGILKIRVTKNFNNSTVNKILDLVENATNRKSKSENFISKFAKYYTPIVVILAVILAIFPPMFTSMQDISKWVYRALSFLVVSCPCALVISIPLGFFAGIGGASKIGVLVKGSNYLEALSKVEIMVFDKTGTLTKGIFEVQKVENIGISKDELLYYALCAENNSNHPIANSIKKVCKKDVDISKIQDMEEISGKGIHAIIDKKDVLVGNDKLLKEENVKFNKIDNQMGTIIYVAIDKEYKGYILISDSIKEDSKEFISNLKNSTVRKAVMLSGDRKEVAELVAKELDIDEVYYELLPNEKVQKVEEIMKQKSKDGKLVFVGDGINDAPVLAISDIGIAMGGLGSDAAIEASDIVIMTDELLKIEKAIKISNKTIKIVKQNIVFAIFIKILVLILSALGVSTMWQAVFADVGVSVIAVINSLRALSIKGL